MNDALANWRDQLAAWALPEHITAAVSDSPWTTPVPYFARRADLAVAQGVSYERAGQALTPRGTVLDVGAGAGAASLPLAPLTTQLTAVDRDPGMLDELARRAAAVGLVVRTVAGSWPDVAMAPGVGPHDVVVCHHVFYNAPELDAFARALAGAARRRVVVELTARHPLVALNPLWMMLHGLERPDGPSAVDALDVLREAGIGATIERSPRPPRPGYGSFDELLAVTGRRLCLPPARRPELVDALVALGVDPANPAELAPPDDTVVTLWWDQTP